MWLLMESAPCEDQICLYFYKIAPLNIRLSACPNKLISVFPLHSTQVQYLVLVCRNVFGKGHMVVGPLLLTQF